MMPQQSSRSCREVLEIFQDKDLVQWPGLPMHCDFFELLQLWPAADAGALLGPLGRECHPTSYRYCAVPGYEMPVRVWYARGIVVQIDVDDPLRGRSAKTLLTQLGTPDARLDARYGYAAIEQGEWFYGHRGLSLLCLEEEDLIAALSGFALVGLGYYRERLRIDRGAHPMVKGEPR
jgi:hypothetical protein